MFIPKNSHTYLNKMLYLKFVLSKIYKATSFLFILTVLWSCSSQRISTETGYKLQFLDEYIIDKNQYFQQTPIGGLSEIDFDGTHYYLVCDQASSPRIYRTTIAIQDKKIDTILFTDLIKINKKTVPNKVVDLEGLLYNKASKTFILSSEGSIDNKINASVFTITKQGDFLNEYQLPNYFLIDKQENPRHNYMFEGLTKDYSSTGIWLSTEMPLKKDAGKAKLFSSKAYVRFTHFKDSVANKQFAYQLSTIGRLPYLPFSLNGLTAILNYDKNRFISVERTFAAGRGKKSFKVRLFDVDASLAGPSLTINELKNKKIKTAKKRLLFDFDKIRKKLAYKSIDNIEGISFGPVLPNGNKTLLLIADNNFNSFQPQLNQLILMEIIDD